MADGKFIFRLQYPHIWGRYELCQECFGGKDRDMQTVETCRGENVTILAIESSCDETAVAVVRNGREVLSNIISSQIDLHTLYGGVVPEIASRKHIERIDQVIAEALKTADRKLKDMDAVAVTYGPGLVGALLVGVSAAKAISFASGLPQRQLHRK